MKAVRLLAFALIAYIGIVVLFESFLGFFQPKPASVIVITTTDADGTAQDRVVTPIRDGGQLYVAANHWPRSWYNRALENPDVEVTENRTKNAYRAVPVTGAEHDRLATEHAHSVGFRILTGFPPRYFLRLEPREASAAPSAYRLS
jgi:hypothetical protein